MTLISFALYGDHAEFITDSTSYSKMVEEVGRCSKHLTITHLDAAVLTQGDAMFGDLAKGAALQVSHQVDTFDQLVESAPIWLPDQWSERAAQDDTEGAVFLIGWSDEAQRFTAHAFIAEQEFKPLEVTKPWVFPSSWEHRPSGMELRRVKAWEAAHPQVDQAVEVWKTKPPMPAPDSLDSWVDVANASRRDRALSGGFARVIVAGDVFHTRLSRGEAHTRKIHSFNDSGDEFLKMIEWTAHPLALARDCWCGSGRTFGDCHALAV